MVDLLDLHHLNSEEAEDELHWSAEKELSLTAPRGQFWETSSYPEAKPAITHDVL